MTLAPDDANAHFQRHAVLFSLEDHDGAFAACERAIELAPGVGQLYFERAGCRGFLEPEPEGWRAANIADCDRALELGYRDPDVFAHKAITQQELRDLTAAVATLGAGIAEHPDAAQLYYHRALFRGSMGDDEGRRADLSRAKQLGFACE